MAMAITKGSVRRGLSLNDLTIRIGIKYNIFTWYGKAVSGRGAAGQAELRHGRNKARINHALAIARDFTLVCV